jgi:hypothetical protein
MHYYRMQNTPIPGPATCNSGAIAVWMAQFPRGDDHRAFGIHSGHQPAIATTRGGILMNHGTFWFILIPPYWLLIFFGLLPAIWTNCYYRSRRQRQLVQGLCPTCSYDLRASRDVCPECGTPITKMATE